MFILKTLGRVLFSGLVAYGGCVVVNMGYDWGYTLANRLVNVSAYPCCSNQGQMAVMSLQYLIFPMTAFWSLGYLTRNEKNLALPLILAVLGCAIAFYHLPFLGSSIIDKVAWPTISLILALAAFVSSRKLFKFLQFRMDPAAIYVPAATTCVAACSTMLLYFIPEWSDLWSATPGVGAGLEWLSYFALVAVPGYFAARAAKPNGIAGGAFAGFLASLPIIAANVLNVGGNLISLGLDPFGLGANLGSSALLSAVAIAVTALIACTTGGAVAAKAATHGVALHR